MVEGAFHEYKEKPGSCADCGNSPVNHFHTYFLNSVHIWSSALTVRIPLFARMEVIVHRALSSVGPAMAALFHALGLLRYGTDPSAAFTYRSQVIWEEARRRGIPMEQLVVFGKPTEVYRARPFERWEYFESIPVPAHLESESSDIDDKFRFKSTLAAHGIPVPRVFSAKSVEEARAAYRELGASVVVKPQVGSRGRHTTVRVVGEQELVRAFESAKRLCRFVAIEEYVSGPVCRGTVVGGKLAGFFEARPPEVVGDGQSTIRELVARANTERPERVQEIAVTGEHERFIASLGHSLDSVPPAGERLVLTYRTGRLFGGRTRELFGSEHPKLREYLERAAAILGVPVVGFDLIIADPEADPDTQTWGIIEANSLPYIDLHYLPLHGTPTNVAAAVWDLWLTEARANV